MSPTNGFVYNNWYVGAWAQDVGSDKPIERLILGEPVVLYRTTAGDVVALEGRCAHRRMPLKHARIEEDSLVCCYHGLTYDREGTCVRIPGQATAPKGMNIRGYPSVERYGAVWLWMGDADKADPSTIFDCALIDADGANAHQFYFHVKANYLYLNDNLSDLLHQAYLHNPSFGGNTDPLGESRPSIKEDDSHVRVKWDWHDVEVPRTIGNLGKIDGRADGWNYSLFEPPSFYINSTGFAKAGTGGIESPLPQGDGKMSFTIYQLITPETAQSTHFFKLVHCEWPPELLGEMRSLTEKVNAEDIWACEEQQRMENLDPVAPIRTISTDRPVAAMRRILDRRLLAETRQSAS